MKGIVFTIDAVFALLIAAAVISVLLYFVYAPPLPYNVQYSSSSALISQLASTKFSALTYIPLSRYMSIQQSSGQNWPLTFKDQQNNAGNNNGPSSLTLQFVFNASQPIMNGTIISDYGNIYFASGNSLYAVNISSGNRVWQTYSPYNSIFGTNPNIYATMLYNNLLLYATAANVVAVNAQNGATVWNSGTYFSSTTETVRLFQYFNKVIVQTYDPSGQVLSITILNSNNGTSRYGVAVPSDPNPFRFYGVIKGQIVDTTPGQINLVTGIYNGTPPFADIWSLATLGVPSSLSLYQNYIVFSSGTTANVLFANGTSALNVNVGASVYGISVYKGFVMTQAGNFIIQGNTHGLGGWTASMPSAFGTGIANTTPVVSSQNVYTIWSGKRIAVLNLSTGSMAGNTTLPYSGYINPYMLLAYGRLVASQGSHLMVFGSCPVNPSDSLLSAIGTLYVNGQGSCAEYLLNSVASPANYSFTINGASTKYVAHFNGNSRIFAPNQFGVSSTCNMTVVAWSDYQGNSGSPNQGVIRLNSTTPSGISFGTGTVRFELSNSGSTNSWTEPGNFQNAWTMSSLVLRRGVPYGYINGAAYPSTSGSIGCIGIGNATIGVYSGSYFNGNITDIQIYNSSLSTAQINQLYREGITAPPISNQSLVGWFPLAGDANNYAGSYSAGYPFGVSFPKVIYNSTSLQNSFSITSQSAPLAIFNYSTGRYRIYNVGVYSWR